ESPIKMEILQGIRKSGKDLRQGSFHGQGTSRIPAIEPDLDSLNDENIPGYQNCKRGKERERRRDEAKEPPDRCKRQDTGNQHDKKGACRKEPAWPAFPEGGSPRPDDEDHERLGTDRLDEPRGLEERDIGIEDEKENTERDEVKDRADRAEDDNKLLDKTHVPLLGCADVRFVYLVGRDSRFREVVEEVVEQDLDGEHRQKL